MSVHRRPSNLLQILVMGGQQQWAGRAAGREEGGVAAAKALLAMATQPLSIISLTGWNLPLIPQILSW